MMRPGPMLFPAPATVAAPSGWRRGLRLAATGAVLAALAACGDGFDWDLRPSGSGSTADAARQSSAPRPQPDARGVISYPGYQVVVARRGETVAETAQRLGLDAGALASRNALERDTRLAGGEVLTLPDRVAEASSPRGADVGAIATSALDRADAANGAPAARAPAAPAGPEPVRHTVERGETAFTIARLYNVTPRSLADWNGLGADMAVRAGQTLLIPVAADADRRTAAAAPSSTPSATPSATPAAERAPQRSPEPEPAAPRPGAGSPTPTPPSATRPLPQDDPAVAPAPAAPPSPDLAAQRSPSAGSTRLSMPVDGRIIREFAPGRSENISVAGTAGGPVRAAADGTVARIMTTTQQTRVLLIRHEGNLFTAYANIQNIRVESGQSVRRGDRIADLPDADPAFVVFQVLEGVESVDPMPYLQ